MKREGYGATYQYDHDAPEAFSGQNYWPDKLGRQALYDPFWALHAAQELGCDADFEMWTPEYGWWLEKRKNNLVGIRK